jgi:antirestriction protein ArdC
MGKKRAKRAKRDVYQEVTNSMIAKLEAGVVPWRKPWRMPTNLVSKKAYRGINTWLLSGHDYKSPYWLTYRQAQSLGGHVKAGEKGTQIVFWKFFNKPRPLKVNDDGEIESQPDTWAMAKAYTVFNVEQCEGVKVPERGTDEAVDVAGGNALLEGYVNPPQYTEGGQRAYYRPSEDRVNVPSAGIFESSAAYLSTKYHEYVHSTGHEARLGRIEHKRFADDAYSEEELTAEMGASYLSAMAGIEQGTQDNSAAYIGHWLQRLHEDKRFIMHVSSAAQKAVDHIVGA